MPSDTVSRDAVLDAMKEYDQLSHQELAARFSTPRSRKYVVTHDAKEYDIRTLLSIVRSRQAAAHHIEHAGTADDHKDITLLRSLGFPIRVTRPDPSSVQFTETDCHLFKKYPQRVPWNAENVPPQDQSHFKEIWNKLKLVAAWLESSMRTDIPLQSNTSILQPNARTARDMWCCAFPATVSNKSYALQAALIISERGAEICICPGGGKSQITDTGKANSAAAQFHALQRKLTSVPLQVITAVEQGLPPEARFRRSWRMEAGSGEFTSLQDWLAYAARPEGAQASISVYLDPGELEEAGTYINDILLNTANAVAPLFEYCYLGEESPMHPVSLFDVDGLRALATEPQHRLKLNENVYRSVVSAIRSGKHVILTGPPGTAKTTLAELICQLAENAGLCEGHTLTTATADWTTYETIGGLRPRESGAGLEFRDGLFLKELRRKRWLVIDELNRSNFDRAFGQLFTVLSKQPVVLPYEDGKRRPIVLLPSGTKTVYPDRDYDVISIPESWRIIATMNVFDKSLLFDMSFALMRRFAFIEVPVPPRETYRELWANKISGASEEHRNAINAILDKLYGITKHKEIGPATFNDMARYALEYAGDDPLSGAESEELSFQLFYSYLLPQFEGISQPAGKSLFREMRSLVGSGNEDRLYRTLTAVLGLDLGPLSSLQAIDSSENEMEF
ncbi:AAA family ATPase [Actinomadura montaniterrae]|uniref:AAA family ATPase n=1 Tax=Actinomadura montaniterrae TaxID=1803903 RepID=A0A6L3VKJ9_9ACTN|nr:AAA family ATPase [Actinomadura montaniterrae]KAB2360993.1 AAA family ATPase [Actinomadura montaniterrae]